MITKKLYTATVCFPQWVIEYFHTTHNNTLEYGVVGINHQMLSVQGQHIKIEPTTCPYDYACHRWKWRKDWLTNIQEVVEKPVEEETFGWLEVMKLFAEGVGLDVFTPLNGWQDFGTGCDRIIFDKKDVYRRKPVPSPVTPVLGAKTMKEKAKATPYPESEQGEHIPRPEPVTPNIEDLKKGDQIMVQVKESEFLTMKSRITQLEAEKLVSEGLMEELKALEKGYHFDYNNALSSSTAQVDQMTRDIQRKDEALEECKKYLWTNGVHRPFESIVKLIQSALAATTEEASHE